MPFDFVKPRFLLCEGDDDKGFLETLIKEHALPDFQVCAAAECNAQKQGGRSGFRLSLDSGIQVLSGFGQLRAILIVSDNDKAGSFAEVQAELAFNGHTPPVSTDTVGTVFGKPVAVLMVPADGQGDLEKVCFPEICRVWPKANECVSAFMACTGADKWAKPASINKARARAASVGFYEPDPFKGIGHLFRNGTLSTANACFEPLVGFLKAFDAMVGIR